MKQTIKKFIRIQLILRMQEKHLKKTPVHTAENTHFIIYFFKKRSMNEIFFFFNECFPSRYRT